jgi:arsenate reductase
MITVIGIPNCDTIRKTRKWLEANNVEYDFVDVKKEPLTKSEITELASKVTFDTLVNRRGTTWRKLDLGDMELSDQQLLDMVEKNQTVIKRPVIVDEEGAVIVGFDEDALASFVEDQKE